eukprot:9504182-Pyramimonas_sp.AAC.8
MAAVASPRPATLAKYAALAPPGQQFRKLLAIRVPEAFHPYKLRNSCAPEARHLLQLLKSCVPEGTNPCKLYQVRVPEARILSKFPTFAPTRPQTLAKC